MNTETKDVEYFEGDFIDARVVELLNTPEYDPNRIANLSSSLASANLDDTFTIWDHIENKDWAKLGLKLHCMTMANMEKQAEIAAIGEYNAGLLGDES